MRVLFLSNEFPTPENPNQAVFNRDMIRGLARRHQVHVVCPVAWTAFVRGPGGAPAAPAPDTFTSSFPRYFFPPRVALHRRGTWMWWSLRRELLTAVTQGRPDVVLSYWAHPDGEVAWRLARRVGVPVALMVGGSDILLLTKDPRRRTRIMSVLHGVDAVLTVGEHLRDQVVAMGVSASRVTSVMRPVDTSLFFPADRASARRRLGLPQGHAVVLAVGRLVPVKAIDVLLRAVALLRRERSDLLVCVAGEGPERRNLAAMAERLRVADVVRWLGMVPHEALPDWYRAADATVLPSLSEGVPNALLESIACGTPFVATRVGSIPHVADEACDRLVPPGDEGTLATALGGLLASDKRAAVRRHRVPDVTEFQARLDEVLARCTDEARLTPSRRPTLRSATRVKPSRWRQAARSVLIAGSPPRWLVGSGDEASRAVCLTFDDGPDERATPGVLDVLKREGVRATFFVRGDRACVRPDLVRRVVNEGHLLGHHSWSHSLPYQTTARRLLAEVHRTRTWLRGELGVDSTWFRPPSGKVTLAKLLALWIAGQTVALWSVDPGDLSRADAQELLDWFVTNPLRGGDVVLLHDTSLVTVEALPGLIARARAAGLELTTLDRFGGPARPFEESGR